MAPKSLPGRGAPRAAVPSSPRRPAADLAPGPRPASAGGAAVPLAPRGAPGGVLGRPAVPSSAYRPVVPSSAYRPASAGLQPKAAAGGAGRRPSEAKPGHRPAGGLPSPLPPRPKSPPSVGAAAPGPGPAFPSPRPARRASGESPVTLKAPRHVTFDASRLSCTICNNYFTEAQSMPCCEAVFCLKCIRQSLTRRPVCPTCRRAVLLRKLTPATTLQQMVDSHPATCPYANNGCPVHATVTTINAHISSCAYASAHCEGCGGRLLRRDEAAHIATCGAVPVRCKFGCDDIVRRDLAAHYTKCPQSSKFQMEQYRLGLTFPPLYTLTLKHNNTTATYAVPDLVERCVFPDPLPAVGFWQIKIVGQLLPLQGSTDAALLFVGVTPHVEVKEVNFLGMDPDECAFDCAGDVNLSGTAISTGMPWGPKDVVGVFVDQTEGFVEFYKNGRLACHVDYASDVDLFPAVCWQCRGTVSLM